MGPGWVQDLLLFRTYGTGMLYPCNLLRMFGPHGTVVWACYLMLFCTYGTGIFYDCNLLRRLGPDGTGMGARFNVIPYLRNGHVL